MNPALLIEHFSQLSQAPGAVPRLRQFIFDLAVRGKLVEQDPNDESVFELLKRLNNARTALVDTGAIKRFQAAAPLTPDTSFPLPKGWVAVHLGGLLEGDSRNGCSRKPDEAKGGIPILRISAATLRRDGLVAEEEHKLISGLSLVEREQYSLRAGDLLACRFNGSRAFVGHLALYVGYLPITPIYPDKLIRLRLLSEFVLPQLVRHFFDSDLIRGDIERYCATTVGNWGISASNLKEVRIPIPPLAEQRRIVGKINELLALCEQLEEQLTIINSERSRLLEAVLHRALLSEHNS